MNRKCLSAPLLLVTLALLLPGLLLPFTFLPGSPALPVGEVATNFSVRTHLLTANEAAQLELSSGTYTEGADYNKIIDGHGTGLAPPTAAQYSEMVGNVLVTDSVHTGLMSTASYDLSSQPYFPPVGNQWSQGSCAAWAMTYYAYGYMEARDNNWTDTSTGNVAHLMSPSWTYNRVNYGIDRGTFMDNIAHAIADWGVASMMTMPYVVSDVQSWGTEDAAREAPLHRADSVGYIGYSSSNPNAAFSNIRNLISANVPVTFAIDANVFTTSLADNIITAAEYNSVSMNHAQTIVGYDDSKTDGVHTDMGAFKVVNSWGKNWGNGGYYWVSYEAMKKIGSNLFLTYINDRPSYQPTLLAIAEFNNAPSRESSITVGVGAVGGTDKFVPYFEENNDPSVAAIFPSFMAFDMTDLLSAYQSGKTSFYLTLGTTATDGNVSSFRIERYQNGYGNAATQVSGQSGDVPKVNPGSVTVMFTPYPTISPDTALDNVGLSFTNSGNAFWSPVTRDSHSGGSAMQSGNVGNNAKSAIQTTVRGPSTISFWWKASSETTDVLRFYIDSVNRANVSGATAWTQVSLGIANGTHLLKWEYVKDASIAGNQDLVLLDQLVATSEHTAPSAPTGLMATVGSSIRLNWSTPYSDGGSTINSYMIYRGTSSGTESLLASVPTSSLAYTDDSAEVNQNYFYQVTAVSSTGESPRSNEASGKIPITVPSAPTSMVATVDANHIDLSWSSNGISLTGFHLYRGTAADAETLFQTLSSSARSYRDSTATAGITYYYRVDAFNGPVSSSFSNEASARIPVVPNAPTALAAVSGSGVHLSWTAPLDNGGSPVLVYKVYRGTSASGEATFPIGTVGSAAYDDIAVSAGTRYYYIVKANNAIGDSLASNEVTVRVPTVPGAPTSLNAVAVGTNIHLSWTSPADNGGASINQYVIYRGTSPSAESATSLGTADVTSYADGSAVVGTQYYYVVRAINLVGESASSNEASSRTLQAPDAPSSLTVSASIGHVSLSWTAPLFNGGDALTFYKVFRGITTDMATQVQIGTALDPSYDDTQITVGQTYSYSVKAVNIVGSSVASNVVPILVKGLPSVPETLTTQISDSSVLLSWSAPTSNGHSAITGYKVYRSATSGTGSFVATVTGTTYSDNGLVNGNVYFYRISAVNAMGEGPQCVDVHDSPASVPAAPMVAGDTSSPGSVDLSWSSPENGVRAITGFSVYRGISTNFASAIMIDQSIIGNGYRDPSVLVDSIYYYFVTGTNQIGTSAPGSFGPVFISGSPSEPRSVTATSASDHIQLSWSAPASPGSSSVSGFYVYRSMVSGQGTVIAHLANVLTYGDAEVSPGQTYYYSVSAENLYGMGPFSSDASLVYVPVPGSPSNEITHGTTISAPSEFNITATVGDSNVTIRWTIPSSNGTPLLRFSIIRTESQTGTVTLTDVSSTNSSYVDYSVIPGYDYTYKVTAVNAAGSTSVDPVAVNALRTVTFEIQIVPFQSSISVSGAVTDLLGQGIGGQKVTIYRSTSMTGAWTALVQLTTSPSGKFSSMLDSSSGIVRLSVVLSSDGTHVPIFIDQTVGSLRLRNGNLASIVSSSAMSEVTIYGTEDLITFSLEQAGAANVSIPKDSVANLDLIGVSIDGKQGNYQVTETEDQYVFSLNVKAGQKISMSIGQPATEGTVPVLAGMVLFISAIAATMVIWRGRRKLQA